MKIISYYHLSKSVDKKEAPYINLFSNLKEKLGKDIMALEKTIKKLKKFLNRLKIKPHKVLYNIYKNYLQI